MALDEQFLKDTFANMREVDRDLRWMACHHLTARLQQCKAGSLGLSESQEQRLVEAVCKVVTDRSVFVAQKAQEILGPLVPFLKAKSLGDLLRVLVHLVINEVDFIIIFSYFFFFFHFTLILIIDGHFNFIVSSNVVLFGWWC